MHLRQHPQTHPTDQDRKSWSPAPAFRSPRRDSDSTGKLYQSALAQPSNHNRRGPLSAVACQRKPQNRVHPSRRTYRTSRSPFAVVDSTSSGFDRYVCTVSQTRPRGETATSRRQSKQRLRNTVVPTDMAHCLQVQTANLSPSTCAPQPPCVTMMIFAPRSSNKHMQLFVKPLQSSIISAISVTFQALSHKEHLDHVQGCRRVPKRSAEENPPKNDPQHRQELNYSGISSTHTFRWIRNHVPRCPLAAGVVCCLPTCVEGSSISTGVFASGESAGCGGMEVIPCDRPRFHQPWIATPFFALHPSVLLAGIGAGSDVAVLFRTPEVGILVGFWGCLPTMVFLDWNRLSSLLNCNTHLVLWLRRAHWGNSGQR